MLRKAGTSYPSTAVSRSSTCSRCMRNVSNSLAALLFLLKDQIPQKYPRKGIKRPFGPEGFGKGQQSAATDGLSRFATAQADGGLKINAVLPEISARLLE